MNIFSTPTSVTINGGNTAEDSATASSPVMVGGYVRTTATPTTLIAGDGARLTMSTGAALVTTPYSVPDLYWSYAAAAGGILNTTTAVTVKAAGTAGVRNYVSTIHVNSEALGAATELAIRDGAAGTVLWRVKIPTAGMNTSFNLDVPLRGTAATLLEVVTLTASVTGAVYVNITGFQSV